MKVKFIHEDGDQEHHECVGVYEGDWEVYRCPLCPEYERRFNRKSGQMLVCGQSLAIRHSGSCSPFYDESTQFN